MIFRFLRREIDNNTNEENVDLLPMEKIRLIWKYDRISDDFTLVQNWLSNTHLPTVVKFHFVCGSSKSCKSLESSMENSPEMFHSLELEYTISGRLTSKRTINVFGSHFEKSRLWSKMINMNTGSSIRYLKSEDLKQLSTETARKIVASVKTDSDYTVTGNELKIHEVIEKVLSENKVDVSKFNDVKWDSVYWDSDMARPDKQTSYLNKFYSKNDTDDSLSTTKNESTEVGRTYGATVGYGGFTVGANYRTTDKEGNSLTVEQMKRQLKESDSHVQWNGENSR